MIICKTCLMDSTAEGFTVKSDKCNFCIEFKSLLISYQNQKFDLEKLVDEIKNKNKNKPYDCIVGVSGGVDSSYSLLKAKELGLRPLAVHMDNGWNSELGQKNIESLVKNLNVDLSTHVINWSEYRSVMNAFFKADVIDIELLMDNAMTSVLYKAAAKWNIKYILAGTNLATEGMRMPSNWNWFKFDKKNIRGIARKDGFKKFETFPLFGVKEFLFYRVFYKIKWISFLDYFEYDKDNAINELEKNVGFRKYRQKHYESVFTKFYQGYILPMKFGIDKRKLHLSNLILTGQIDREKALKILEKSPLLDFDNIENDKEYFSKKMKWTNKDLENYINRPEKKHSQYPTEYPLWLLIKKLYRFFGGSGTSY